MTVHISDHFNKRYTKRAQFCSEVFRCFGEGCGEILTAPETGCYAVTPFPGQAWYLDYKGCVPDDSCPVSTYAATGACSSTSGTSQYELAPNQRSTILLIPANVYNSEISMTVTSGSAYLTIQESDGSTCEFDDLSSCSLNTNARSYFDGNTQVFSFDSSVNGFIIGIKTTDSSGTMNLAYSWSLTVTLFNCRYWNYYFFCLSLVQVLKSSMECFTGYI